MASTLTIPADGKVNIGNKLYRYGTGNLGVYATNGVAVAAAQCGLSVIEDFQVFPAGGYAFEFDKTNLKVKAYRVPTVTPGGTVAVTMTDGYRINTYAPGGGDIQAADTVDVPIAGGTLPTGGQYIATLQAADNTNNFTIALQPDVSWNVCIAFKNTVAGASTGNAVTCLITGTYRGVAQTESIAFTALELTSTAQNEVAAKYGSKPFDTITSITCPVAQPALWQRAAGLGSKLGLPTILDTPAEADVLKITKDGADLAVAGLVSTANNTVNLGTMGAASDVAIVYKEDFDGAAGTAVLTGTPTGQAAFAEVTNAVDLSGITFRFSAWGH